MPSVLQLCQWDDLNIIMFGLAQIANGLTVIPHFNEMNQIF